MRELAFGTLLVAYGGTNCLIIAILSDFGLTFSELIPNLHHNRGGSHTLHCCRGLPVLLDSPAPTTQILGPSSYRNS